MEPHMSRPLPRYQPDRDPNKLDRIIPPDTDTPTTTSSTNHIGHRTSEGDQRRLRAIPVIAPAVGGTIPGTNPLNAYLNKEHWKAKRCHRA
jgi:hypothetical protein